MATELLMEISQEERERAIMRSRRMYETDRFNEMQTAIDRGIAKGMEKGMAKGRAEGKAEIIELLDKGVSIDEIKTRLGL